MSRRRRNTARKRYRVSPVESLRRKRSRKRAKERKLQRKNGIKRRSQSVGFCKSPEEVAVRLNLAWKSRAFVLFYRTAFFWFVSWCWWLAQNLASWFHPFNCDLLERLFPALDAGCIRWSLFALWLVLLWFADSRTQGERNGAKHLFLCLDILHSC